MSNRNYQFKCRVFAGRIISVDCAGLPSELFAAKVVNGRITLHSIARRQCKEYILNKSPSNHGISSGENIIAEKPLAVSTPAIQRLSKKNNLSETRFPTPDIVRRATIQQRNSPISSPIAFQRMKVVPLYRTPTLNTPLSLAKIAPITRKSGEVKSICVTQIQVLRNLSNLSNFESLTSPNTTNNTTVSKSPNQTLITKLISSPRCSVDKWRKCLTPQRTYLRPNVGQKKQIQLRKSASSLQVDNVAKVVPNYFVNQTKNPVGEEKIIFRRRKLIVDKKLAISPKSFKKQLQFTEDLEHIDEHLPKTRKQFLYSQKLAFDLLTNSSFYPRCAGILNTRFRRGCVNKKSETILKYQQLTNNIPVLEE